MGPKGGFGISEGEQVNEVPGRVLNGMQGKHPVLTFMGSYLTMVLRQGIFILKSGCSKILLVWI